MAKAIPITSAVGCKECGWLVPSHMKIEYRVNRDIEPLLINVVYMCPVCEKTEFISKVPLETT